MLPEAVLRAAMEVAASDGAEAAVALIAQYYTNVLALLVERVTGVTQLLEAGAPGSDVLEPLLFAVAEAQAVG